MKYLNKVFALAFILVSFSISGKNATDIINRSASKIESTPSITSDLAVFQNSSEQKGKLTMSGAMFTVVLPEAVVWFDGKSMWSYSKATGEVNLTEPTLEELSEINPLAFVLAAKNKFNKRLLKSASANEEVVELRPRKGIVMDVSKVVVTFDKTTSLPSKITVYPRNNCGIVTLKFRNTKTGGKLPVSVFRFNKKDYPDAELIDLR